MYADSRGGPEMVDILSCSLDELRGLFEKFGEKPFRANQVFDWVYNKRAQSLSEMTNLSKGLRERLEKSLAFPVMDIAQRQVSSDGTEKFLLALEDGNYIESVLLKHPDHTTFCISSQVGCPLNCSFCATGASGFTRDLTPGEIVGQVVLMEREQGRPVDNIVFMGMGEPFLNEESVYKAIDILHEPAGRNLGMRHFTISTAGLPDAIRRLADSGRELKLSISLHSVDDTVRSGMMPVNRKYPLPVLKEALEYYQARTGNRLTFEYALVEGLNDSVDDALRLAEYLKGLKSFVNVIPVNPVNAIHKRPTDAKIQRFIETLKSKRLETALRYERGTDIAAACGQLRQRKGGRAWKGEEA